MWNLLNEIGTIVKIANPLGWLKWISEYVWSKIWWAVNKSVNPQYTASDLNNWNRYTTSWIASLLNSESTLQRNEQINKQLDNIANKHTVRMNIANWNISSGNKNNDKLEKARSALADYARVSYLNEAQKDKSMDLSVLDKMKDQDIVDWLIEWDDNAKQTYIDFVNNWWVVWNVYNSIMWINPEEEKEIEKQQSSSLKNFIWAATNEVPRQLWGLMDIMWLTDYLNNKEKAKLEQYKTLSTDEFNKFMNWEINYKDLGNKSWMYNDYKTAVERWHFVGSVEDYGNTIYNQRIWDTDKTAQEHLRDESWLNYNEEWKWAEAWKMATQTLEFFAMPWAKWNWLMRTLVWAWEILWIDALSEWKLPTAWEAGVTSLINGWIEALLKIPWGKWLQKQLAWATPEVVKALWRTTKEEWKNFSNVVNWWLEETKRYATKLLDKAAGWLKTKLSEEWTRLQNIRKNMKWEFTYEDYFNAINNKFKNFEKEWWDKNAVPEIKINKKTWELEIYNEEALSNITDVNWQKLTDMIKSEWEAYRNQWRKWDIRDVENLMKNMEQKIYAAVKSWWIKSSDSAVKSFLEWTKDAYEWLYKAMWWEWTMFKNSRERFHTFSDYAEFFDKYIWNIKLWNKPLDQIEKTARWEKSMWNWTNAIWDFLDILKNDHVINEDIKSQLISLVYAFWIKNPKQVQKLLEWIYPSMPGIQEIWLEILRQRAKNKYAQTLLKDADNSTSPWEHIKRAVWQAGLVELE